MLTYCWRNCHLIEIRKLLDIHSGTLTLPHFDHSSCHGFILKVTPSEETQDIWIFFSQKINPEVGELTSVAGADSGSPEVLSLLPGSHTRKTASAAGIASSYPGKKAQIIGLRGGSSKWMDKCTAPCGQETSQTTSSAKAGRAQGCAFLRGSCQLEGLERSTEPDSCQKSIRHTNAHILSQACTYEQLCT